MKILWIVNKPIGALHEYLYGKKATGGLWLEAMIERAREDNTFELVIVNVAKVKTITEYKYNRETYYTIPGEPNEHYDYKSENARRYWQEIFATSRPDVIEIWGSEFPYAIPALEVAKDIPSIVFVQGILESIGRYYTAGMSTGELRKAISIRDFFTRKTIRQEGIRYLKRSIYDKDIVTRSGNILAENQWTIANYMPSCPSIKVFKCPLCISQVFSKYEWSTESANPQTIMCSAANYSIKGLHMLLKALAIVKQHYPNVKLNIPGTRLRKALNFKFMIKQSGYEKFICSLIEELKLEENVNYMGRLTGEQMAEKMASTNVFVMASAIENHSSTLKEAMTVGVPCVASYVGGVQEYAVHGENCLLYRYEDFELLALHIMTLFENPTLCTTLSTNARECMKKSRENNDFYAIHKDVYMTLIKDSRK